MKPGFFRSLFAAAAAGSATGPVASSGVPPDESVHEDASGGDARAHPSKLKYEAKAESNAAQKEFIKKTPRDGSRGGWYFW